jgi:excinuclease ABC subunit B
MTGSLETALAETERRRNKQRAFNEANGITPESIKKQIGDIMRHVAERDHVTISVGEDAPETLSGVSLQAYIAELETKMKDAAANLEFEEAARLRDEIRRLEASELGVQLAPTARSAAQRGKVETSRGRAQRMARAKRQRGVGSRR